MNTRSFFFVLLFSFSVFSQKTQEAYQPGEWLKYRVHYGIVNAGYATLKVAQKKDSTPDLIHFIGKGWTVGLTNLFFKVRDRYESFVDQKSRHPVHFKRRVHEGGYTLNRDSYFDLENHIAKVVDHKKKSVREVEAKDVQDLISSFYFLRNKNIDTLAVGDSLELDLFFDAETFPFKLVYLGKENISTKYGKVRCHKMRPHVMSGRVFKARESLTVWISSDANKIPIRIKASLAVGALKVDLNQYRGLSHPFPIIL